MSAQDTRRPCGTVGSGDGPYNDLLVSATVESPAERGLAPRLQRVRDSKLVRQNLVLFLGGFTAGVGGVVFHPITGRTLRPPPYGGGAPPVGLFPAGSN